MTIDNDYNKKNEISIIKIIKIEVKDNNKSKNDHYKKLKLKTLELINQDP